MDPLPFTPRPVPRAAFAADPRRTRGRRVAEQPSRTRTEFQRDRDRIIHSTAFRRLAYKTQVFVPSEDDHFRTRLTHTIEVSQIARALARALDLDADLAETLALAHDLGHTPFGHTGEEALDACLRDFGGFDHNSHALRIVTALECRYADFDGLNLTWETLEGLVKHNGPLLGLDRTPAPRYRARGVPAAIIEIDRGHSLELWNHASAEAQCAAVADDIAYNAHDIDDGLRAGLFELSDLASVDFVADLTAEVDRLYPRLEPMRAVHEVGRRIITRFVEDVIRESSRRLTRADPGSADAVRAAGQQLVGFSGAMESADADIKAFLMPRMYRHPRLVQERQAAVRVVRRLFEHFLNRPAEVPGPRAPAIEASDNVRARAAADYIAGMTDRFAQRCFTSLFDEEPGLG